MNHEVEVYPGELKHLRELVEKFKTILAHATPDKSGMYFICGGTDVEEDGLPKTIHVCPHFGLDGFATYTKTGEYSAPSY